VRYRRASDYPFTRVLRGGAVLSIEVGPGRGIKGAIFRSCGNRH
jgi:hypothetical protein